MARKSTRQKLVEKLYEEHGIILDPHKMHSFRRNGFGTEIVSWATVGQEQNYRSFWTMGSCLKYPTTLGRHNDALEITIDVNLDALKRG